MLFSIPKTSETDKSAVTYPSKGPVNRAFILYKTSMAYFFSKSKCKKYGIN
jgi:hypothetical protein